MLFRKQGKLVEICRTHYKTDGLYYNEIYKLYKEQEQENDDECKDVAKNSINTTNKSNAHVNNVNDDNNTITFIQSLLLKNHSV